MLTEDEYRKLLDQWLKARSDYLEDRRNQVKPRTAFMDREEHFRQWARSLNLDVMLSEWDYLRLFLSR